MIAEIKKILYNLFDGPDIKIWDTVGDGHHLALNIRAKEFKNKTLLQQHRMITDALKGILGAKLHALQINTEIME